jgi:lauroyl/myristoyl acyltransferase
VGSPGRRTIRWLRSTSKSRLPLALRAAGLVGGAFGPVSSWAPSREEVRAVFPDAPVDRVQRRIAANLLRDLSLAAVANREGSVAVLDRVDVVGAGPLLELQRSGAPLVIVFGHLGARRGPPLAVEKLGIPARLTVEGKRPRRMGCVQWQEVHDAGTATRFLRDALQDLKKGTVPVVAVDRAHGSGPEVRFLGRRIRVSRGLAALARAGATLVPMRAVWTPGPRIEVTVLPPLPGLEGRRGAEAEARFLQTCVGWVQDYATAHPGELGLAETRHLAGLPPDPASP